MISVDKIKARCIEDGDCWLWQGVINGNRPQMTLDGKTVAVRRELWKQLRSKSLLREQLVTTKCGVRDCVNPDHLCVRTMSQVQTKVGLQGKYSTLQRRTKVAEAKRLQAKLTPEAVVEIRASNELLKVLAARYGVSMYCISSVRTGRTWKNYSSPFAGLM